MSRDIYIIGSDPNEIGALSALLGEVGMDVTIARSGQDGIEGVQRSQPDTVIMAAELGDMSGPSNIFL